MLNKCFKKNIKYVQHCVLNENGESYEISANNKTVK